MRPLVATVGDFPDLAEGPMTQKLAGSSTAWLRKLHPCKLKYTTYSYETPDALPCSEKTCCARGGDLLPHVLERPLLLPPVGPRASASDALECSSTCSGPRAAAHPAPSRGHPASLLRSAQRLRRRWLRRAAERTISGSRTRACLTIGCPSECSSFRANRSHAPAHVLIRP